MPGGETDRTLKRVVAYCDGWLPRAFGGFDSVAGVARLHGAAQEAGRAPSSVQVTVFGAAADAAVLAHHRGAGIQRGLLAIPHLGRNETPRLLGQHAPLAAAVRQGGCGAGPSRPRNAPAFRTRPAPALQAPGNR